MVDPSCITTRNPVSRLLEPQSIAVIGASANPSKRGFQIIHSLLRNGYPHAIYPVNPKGGQILDIDVFPTIEDLPEDIDLAVISRPAAEVMGVLDACDGKGIAGAVILANGFKESGPDGALLQEQLRRFLSSHEIHAIGPNTSGIINFGNGADLVGLKQATRPGPISAITQSGNMLLSLLADVEKHAGPGLDVYTGLGNQIDLGFPELLEALAERPSTKAIAVHAEGFPNGRALLASAAQVARSHPVVLLRGGRSEAGRKTALSHTGSVASVDQVAAGVLKQVGITLIERSDEFAVVAGALACLPMPDADKGVAVLSDGGGHATLAVDQLEASGVKLAVLCTRTRQRLRSQLGDTAVVHNPVDVASALDASPAMFEQCIRILHEDPSVGLVLVVGLLGGYHLRFDPSEEMAENSACQAIAEHSHSRRFPVVVHSCYEHRRPAAHARLRQYGIPVTDSIEHAVACVRALFNRSQWLSTQQSRIRADALRQFIPREGSHGSPASVKDIATQSASHMNEPEVRHILLTHGIETGPWVIAHDAVQARQYVQRFARPCALKVVAQNLAHKSDVGGVRLGVDEEHASSAYEDMLTEIRTTRPETTIQGVLVTPMIDAGTELFIGITIDKNFGPVLAFGAGGISIEAMKDVSFRALPMTHLEAKEMILETRVSKVLTGYRGMPSIDLDELSHFIVRLSSSVLEIKGLMDLEFNPIILNESGLHIADVKLISTA